MGLTVVGERGQIVIPKEIRDAMGLAPGAQLVILRHHDQGPILMFPAKEMKNFMNRMAARFAKLSKLV